MILNLPGVGKEGVKIMNKMNELSRINNKQNNYIFHFEWIKNTLHMRVYIFFKSVLFLISDE